MLKGTYSLIRRKNEYIGWLFSDHSIISIEYKLFIYNPIRMT